MIPFLYVFLKLISYTFAVDRIKNRSRGQHGAAVKITCSASAAQSSPVQIPGAELGTAWQAMLWQASHIESRGRWAQMLAGPVFLSKKRRTGSS